MRVCWWLAWAFVLSIISRSARGTEKTWPHGLFVAPMAHTRCNMSLSLAVSPNGPKKARVTQYAHACTPGRITQTEANVLWIQYPLLGCTIALSLVYSTFDCVASVLPCCCELHTMDFLATAPPFQNSREGIRYNVSWQLAEFIISTEPANLFLKITSQYFLFITSYYPNLHPQWCKQ